MTTHRLIPALLATVSAVALLSGCGLIRYPGTADQARLLEAATKVVTPTGLHQSGAPGPVCELNIDCVDISTYMTYDLISDYTKACTAAAALQGRLPITKVYTWSNATQSIPADPNYRVMAKPIPASDTATIAARCVATLQTGAVFGTRARLDDKVGVDNGEATMTVTGVTEASDPGLLYNLGGSDGPWSRMTEPVVVDLVFSGATFTYQGGTVCGQPSADPASDGSVYCPLHW